ncbi:unnamed protein product [Rotaria sordida]|uniref:SAGA-associated factor 11 n=1 Tax=Rotaria sordida TaxID=392033 RepID=A0A814ZZN5_9BILA|nr:unnamed protein product [Rotaria sordida]CAF1204492.1 unnamed protein product [Rotaria sordida]CAF1250659.1 unnamed protein product [Rotaria sordida]CAF1322875.1 unnamed protein product [Rotaria sordida]CAF1325421.1 unnamed protein product [Rotaria sordida]
MDELSLIIQSIIDTELDDLILDLVYEIHSSLKGIPEDQLEINNNGTKTKNFSIPFSPSQTTAIEKQTCICPQCGQSNIIAIRFAYHLAKCLGVGRRSSRQAKNRIVDQVMTITALSDDSRSNGDEFQNIYSHNIIPEDAGSCTDSTSSSSNNHRRMINEDQEYTGDFDNDDEDEDDWKPKKKKRRNATVNTNNGNKNKRRKKKDDIIAISQPIAELDFHNCIIPLDKLSPRTQHTAVPLVSSTTSLNSENIFLKNRQILPSSPSSHFSARSPLNLVEDEQSSATSIIMFQEDSKR